MSNPYEPPSAEPTEPPANALPAFLIDGAVRTRVLTAAAVVVVINGIAYAIDDHAFLHSFLIRGPYGMTAPWGVMAEGIAVLIFSNTALGSAIIWPRWYTIALAILGVAAWLWAGLFVAMVWAA